MTQIYWPNVVVREPFIDGIPLEHRTYLRDGKILVWEGPVEDVFSPVCLVGQDELRPLRLGSHPRTKRRR